MTQSNSSVLGKVPLGQLVTDALGQLMQLGYSRRSLHRYRTIWERLIEFAHRGNHEDLPFDDLAGRFMNESCVADAEADKVLRRGALQIVSCIEVLEHFVCHGCIERPRASQKSIRVPPAMQNALREYEQYCEDRIHIESKSSEGDNCLTNHL